ALFHYKRQYARMSARLDTYTQGEVTLPLGVKSNRIERSSWATVLAVERSSIRIRKGLCDEGVDIRSWIRRT
ncbi:16340_t:CDS:2, partial [Cetraspora pellucida]